MSWQWWLAQAFTFVGLVFVLISFQQKSTKKLVWLKSVSTLCVFVGFVFLWNVPALLMNGAGVLRNLVAVYFAYRPWTHKAYKYAAGGVIIGLLIALNIVFWKDFYNLYSIILGALLVLTYFQPTAAKIRYVSLISETGAIVYYALLVSPLNIAIESVGLVSAIMGIFRIDKKEEFENELREEIEKKDDEEWQ